jgi:hypothetical protein
VNGQLQVPAALSSVAIAYEAGWATGQTGRRHHAVTSFDGVTRQFADGLRNVRHTCRKGLSRGLQRAAPNSDGGEQVDG